MYFKNKKQKFSKKFADLLYNYIKTVYSYEYREFHKSDNSFYEIISYLMSLDYGDEVTSIYDFISKIQDSRESQKVLYKKGRSTRIYFLLYILLALCIGSIYLLKGNDVLYNLIVGSFTASMILIMQIIVEKRSLASDEYNIFFRPFDEIIDLIGRKRVYAESIVKYGLIDTELLKKKGIDYEVLKGK